MGDGELVQKYQQQLLEQASRLHSETGISEATQKAYLATPRHLFVKRYRRWAIKEWLEISAENLTEHLATLYADGPLILFGEDDEDVPSTISQPSFVLRLLDMLRVEPGQRVFELGTGSGWNAALIGKLVGSEGCVCSVEIIPEVADAAKEAIQALEIKNVTVVEGDGGAGYEAGAPYDRAIFTAGTYDLPRHFYSQMREGGLLLAVIKNVGGGDTLFVLRKTADHFESVDSMSCGFVQLRGKYKVDNLEPVPIESLAEWKDLRDREVSKTSFWWGGDGKLSFIWRTLGIRSFLSIAEPTFVAFKTPKPTPTSLEEHYFGLLDSDRQSLVVAKHDTITSYGNEAAKEHLWTRLRQWFELGMPTASNFKLEVYPTDHRHVAAEKENQWTVKRPESQFIWSLER